MNNYRIKKVTDGDGTRYFPEKRFLFFWWYRPFMYSNRGYDTLKQASLAISDHLRKPEVEYIKFDESYCKSKYSSSLEPNPPPKFP
jgi:hypothetical protein